MSDELIREYRAKARALVADLESLAATLLAGEAGEVSRAFYRRLALELRGRTHELRHAIESGVEQSRLRAEAAEIKRLLSDIAVSSTKGEIPIPDTRLFARVRDLSHVFQELRYTGLPTV